ncbi:hypothetical protein evm_005768 [Chilo suppressalis]|nr:hypothetical protein evm_005768 [Chilo suppressalis]
MASPTREVPGSNPGGGRCLCDEHEHLYSSHGCLICISINKNILIDQDLSDQLDPLALRRDVAWLCIFYRIYHGECSEDLFGLIPAAAFRHRTSRQKFHPHHLDTCTIHNRAFLSKFFYHVRENCGIYCRQQCFQTDTTQKPSKKERTSSLKAGIAFVILLVLQVSMGDGDHLPSGEPSAQAGSDVANIKTTATSDGDYWVLNGKKSWVTSGVEGSATVVFATCDPALRHKGLACFLVPLDAEGVFRGKKESLMGVRASTACDLTLAEVRIPRSNLVGEVGEGFRIAMAQLDQARVGIAAHAVGIAQAALDTAINYAKERVAFGKCLTRLPSVKDRLTDMCILIESARLLTHRAATQVSTKNSAMAKYVAGKNAALVADHCVQILGGRGLSTNYPAERHYRDARGTQIYGGVTDIQKRLVGHYLLKENDAL